MQLGAEVDRAKGPSHEQAPVCCFGGTCSKRTGTNKHWLEESDNGQAQARDFRAATSSYQETHCIAREHFLWSRLRHHTHAQPDRHGASGCILTLCTEECLKDKSCRAPSAHLCDAAV
eukprot:1156198-Pelagomonas_calceolata.AAC.3